jgi:hypothetical protein
MKSGTSHRNDWITILKSSLEAQSKLRQNTRYHQTHPTPLQIKCGTETSQPVVYLSTFVVTQTSSIYDSGHLTLQSYRLPKVSQTKLTESCMDSCTLQPSYYSIGSWHDVRTRRLRARKYLLSCQSTHARQDLPYVADLLGFLQFDCSSQYAEEGALDVFHFILYLCLVFSS